MWTLSHYKDTLHFVEAFTDILKLKLLKVKGLFVFAYVQIQQTGDEAPRLCAFLPSCSLVGVIHSQQV